MNSIEEKEEELNELSMKINQLESENEELKCN
jgi:hypothetical protein